MTDIDIRVLNEDEWQIFRDARLRALKQAPEAFAATFEEEQAYDEEQWRTRMRRSTRLVALNDDHVIGVVSLLLTDVEPTGSEIDDLPVAEVFGLWVEPEHRGSGAPAQMIDYVAHRARAENRSHLLYWVGTDNARAVAFASGYGFRPTDSRRDARTAGTEGGTEAAMVFPLAR